MLLAFSQKNRAIAQNIGTSAYQRVNEMPCCLWETISFVIITTASAVVFIAVAAVVACNAHAHSSKFDYKFGSSYSPSQFIYCICTVQHEVMALCKLK